MDPRPKSSTAPTISLVDTSLKENFVMFLYSMQGQVQLQ